MATYDNDLRLKEITTGDEDGTWGVSTNTNLALIADGFSLGTKEMAADANETFTMPDATADATRSLYLKITSAVSLTATREVTLGPNTVSKTWIIENATSGSQTITIKQGSGATVNVPNGSKVMIVTDGAGAGAAVFNANPTEVGGTVTSIDVSGGTTGLTTSGGPVTTSGTITLAGTLAVANGGTGSTTASGALTNFGLTATATELNYTDGVTSNIQTQLNTKAPLASPTFTGTVTADGLSLGDNDKATFGAGNDLQIYHDAGGTSHIRESGSSNLYIESTNFRLKSSADTGETYLTANLDGAVTLYYDNASKLATTNTGIDVTGTATMDGLTVDGSVDVNNSNLNITSSAVNLNLYETDTTDVNTRIRQSSGTLFIQTLGDTSGVTDRMTVNHSTGDISFYEDTGTTPKFFWDASAESLGIGTTSPSSSHALDVIGDIRIANSTPRLQMVDTDTSNTWYIDGGSNTLIFQNNANERMRIDPNGNLLVGATTTSLATTEGINVGGNGELYVTKDGSYPIIAGRLTSDGDMIYLRRGATKIGSIGAYDGRPYLASTTLGIRVSNALFPSDSSGATTDGQCDIGGSSGRFKDLHLSSTAYINGITVGRGAGAVSTNTAVGQDALASNTSGAENTAYGYEALYSNTTGSSNTATGRDALYSNTTASHNTAVGRSALTSNTTGAENTAVGRSALSSNTTGGDNTAVGRSALFNNTTASYNTALGRQALLSNTTGANNSATGYQTLYSNTTGGSNTATGYRALYLNTTGSQNVANGYQALRANTTGVFNSATGYQALEANTTGDSNTASGYLALHLNTTGDGNTAFGRQSLYSNTAGIENVAVGRSALYYTTGSGNIGLGFRNNAGTYAPVFDPTTENNRVVMGHTAVTNAYVQVAWTVVSDARDKMNFAPVPHGLDFVKQLDPVAYQFKVDRDTETPNGNVRYGFKAQDILALEGDNPVIIDNEDEDKLKYNGESLVPVLVKAMQEQQAIIESLTNRIAALEGN